MAKLKITQVKSTIGCLKNQIATLEALGLNKIGAEKIHEDNDVIRGMMKKVEHLISVDEIED